MSVASNRGAGSGGQGDWAARLEVVGELASLINTTFDLEEIFHAAILRLRRVLKFRRASVVLVSEDRSSYYLHTLYDGARGGFVELDSTFPLEQGLTGKAIATGEALLVEAFGGTEGIRTRGEESVSVMIVPLQIGDVVIGTLNLGAPKSVKYRGDDLELAVLLGRQISTSLYYSKLLATIEEQRGALAAKHAHVESERARLEALINASDAAILLVSDDRVAYANDGMAQLLGLPKEVVVGAPLSEVNRILARSFTEPGALAVQMAALEKGGTPLRDRVELVFPRKLICNRTVATVKSGVGEVIGQLILFRDVTKEAEAEAAKSDFVSLVSHELRTPLTSIKTSLNLLLRGAAGALSEGARDLLEIGLRNLERLIRLVDDLLDLSRIESGQVVAKLTATPLQETLQRAVDAVAGFAHEREVQIDVQIDIEGAHEDVEVLADSDRLQQVIVNLLSNAVKFSPEHTRVGLRWKRCGDEVVVEISDQGPGIPQDQLEVIFDKFHQLERTSTRKYGGAGLGLAISRTIIEQFGGKLWAESTPREGSTFFVRLRVALQAPGRRLHKPPLEMRTARALLVESDPDRRRLWSAEFEAVGWSVEVAGEGTEALANLGRDTPDLLVVGGELADMHGLEFLQRLRSSPSTVDIPAVLAGQTVEAEQAVAYGADGFCSGDGEALVLKASEMLQAGRRLVVLLVEDDPAVRAGVARGLRRSGYACLEAASGEVALEMATQRAPDLIMTDVQVPGTDGLELLRRFRADARLARVPALVVTGHVTPGIAQEVRSLGARFLPKPFAIAEILQEIDRALGRVAPQA